MLKSKSSVAQNNATETATATPRRISRLKKKRERSQTRQALDFRLDAAVAAAPDELGETKKATPGIMIMFDSDTIMSVLEKEDKLDHLHKARVRARSNEPVFPLRQNKSDEERQSDAERQAAVLLFDHNQPYVLSYRGTKAGMDVDKTFFVIRKKKRTVERDDDEALQHPGMKAAMDLEVHTFRRMEVLLGSSLERFTDRSKQNLDPLGFADEV